MPVVEGARSSDEGRLEGMPNSQEAAESYDAGPCSCHFLCPEPGLRFDDVYFQLFRQVVSLGIVKQLRYGCDTCTSRYLFPDRCSLDINFAHYNATAPRSAAVTEVLDCWIMPNCFVSGFNCQLSLAHALCACAAICCCSHWLYTRIVATMCSPGFRLEFPNSV
jgi:hypothetical protein